MRARKKRGHDVEVGGGRWGLTPDAERSASRSSYAFDELARD